MAARFFYLGALEVGTQVILDANESKHAQVLRIESEESIELVNGKGVFSHATCHWEKKVLQAQITSSHFTPPIPSLTLLQAICQPNHLHWLAEKGTELSMKALYLFPAARSPKPTVDLQRLHHLLVAALKQSKGLWLPELKLLPPLLKWTTLPPFTRFGQIDGQKMSYQEWQECQAFLVGPEGGLSPKEISHLEHLGAEGGRLFPNTLRTETAGLVALTMAFAAHQFSFNAL